MNIQLNYLYRDAGNNKFYNKTIFTNKENIELEIILETINKKLIDGEYFIPKDWKVTEVENTYDYDEELDHDWYTFEGIEVTLEGPSENRDIKKFLEEIK